MGGAITPTRNPDGFLGVSACLVTVSANPVVSSSPSNFGRGSHGSRKSMIVLAVQDFDKNISTEVIGFIGE
jgi:hypothetical protein